MYGYIFNLLTDDRPGIVAGVSRVVDRLGGNIEACSQTVLCGYFTLIMNIILPQKWESELLEQEILAELSEKEGGINQVIVREATRFNTPAQERESELFVFTASGKDRTGIVSAFSRYFADQTVNIVNLYGERLYGERTEGDEFLLISQVEVPASRDISNLQLDLEAIGQELGFTVRLQHNNIFVATNRLRLER